MSIIPQQTLFVWDEIENLGDLERLRLVIEYMPDEERCRVEQRGKGETLPVEQCGSILAGVVYQHPSMKKRTFGMGTKAIGLRKTVPPAWAYTRFLKNYLK